jgi:short-subunit dehydrogenase
LPQPEVARSGSDCILLARSEEALHELADALESTHGITASVLPADLSTTGIARDVTHRLDERELSVDVLVNNAGFGARGRFTDLDPQRQVNMIQVNVTALTDLTRRLLPAMLDRNRGGVLNVASTAAFQPGPFMSIYYATKAYVLSFSEGLTNEVADSNVTVSCLAPGPTRTAFVDEAGMNDASLFEWGAPMTPTAVAEAGYEGFRAGRTLTVPGWPNKMGAFMIRFTPRSVARGVAGWLNR